MAAVRRHQTTCRPDEFWTRVWRMWWRQTSGDGDWPQALTCTRLRDDGAQPCSDLNISVASLKSTRRRRTGQPVQFLQNRWDVFTATRQIRHVASGRPSNYPQRTGRALSGLWSCFLNWKTAQWSPHCHVGISATLSSKYPRLNVSTPYNTDGKEPSQLGFGSDRVVTKVRVRFLHKCRKFGFCSCSVLIDGWMDGRTDGWMDR